MPEESVAGQNSPPLPAEHEEEKHDPAILSPLSFYFGLRLLSKAIRVNANGELILKFRSSLKAMAAGNGYETAVKFSPRMRDCPNMVPSVAAGMVTIWPSEQVLAYMCLKHVDNFKDRSVIELAAGATGLAGLVLAKHGRPAEVILTDGGKPTTDNLLEIVACHRSASEHGQGSAVKLSAARLRWADCEADFPAWKQRFDVVLAADCLLYETGHQDLLAAIEHLLKPNGQVLMAAPLRADTAGRFVAAGREAGWSARIIQAYDDDITTMAKAEKSSAPSYDANLYYPVLIKMVREVCLDRAVDYFR